MTYRDALLRLSADTEAKAIQQYDSLDVRDLAEVEALVTATIAKADHKAANFALLAFSVAAMGAMRKPVATPVLPVTDQTDRLAKATATAFATAADSPEPQAIVGRLARCEPLATAHDTYSAALSYDPNVRGWIRAVNPDACELCVWWAKGGKVFPQDAEFRHHPGCSCIQVPVFGSKLPGSGVQVDPKFLGRSKVYDNPNAFKVSAANDTAWTRFEKTLL